jgi:tRNA dimethylallyltransferase
MSDYNCIVVLGPTASGKTRLACAICDALNGEVISADSRQVYKGLDIGTGKDLSEYETNGRTIPYHLIDVRNAGEQFYLHDFVNGLREAFDDITNRGKLPVVCGGTGLYLDALTRDFSYTQVQENGPLREELAQMTKESLVQKLKNYPHALIGHVDTDSRKRLIRGIEIAEYISKHGALQEPPPPVYKPYYVGIQVSVTERRKRIGERLQQRLKQGLIEEVEVLVNGGLSFHRLEHLGLEYRFVSDYLQGRISREVMEQRLLTAINQFAKRQMTWFRKMEKEGVNINWTELSDTPAVISRLHSIFKNQ